MGRQSASYICDLCGISAPAGTGYGRYLGHSNYEQVETIPTGWHHIDAGGRILVCSSGLCTHRTERILTEHQSWKHTRNEKAQIYAAEARELVKQWVAKNPQPDWKSIP